MKLLRFTATRLDTGESESGGCLIRLGSGEDTYIIPDGVEVWTLMDSDDNLTALTECYAIKVDPNTLVWEEVNV